MKVTFSLFLIAAVAGLTRTCRPLSPRPALRPRPPSPQTRPAAPVVRRRPAQIGRGWKQATARPAQIGRGWKQATASPARIGQGWKQATARSALNVPGWQQAARPGQQRPTLHPQILPPPTKRSNQPIQSVQTESGTGSSASPPTSVPTSTPTSYLRYVFFVLCAILFILQTVKEVLYIF